MKTLYKSLFAALTILSICVSIFGCSEKKDAQSTSNSVFSQDDEVSLTLKPGVRHLTFIYTDPNEAGKHGEIVKGILKENGITVLKAKTRPSASGLKYHISITVPQNVTINIKKSGLDAIWVESASGMVADWDPMQGNKVIYKNE